MAKITITPSVRNKIFAALIAAGVTGPSAYVATNLTVPSEGMVNTVYSDTGGLKTACVGHLMLKTDVVKKTYTEDECVKIFVSDWNKHEALVDSAVKAPWRSPWMKGVVTDFTFNKGIGNLKSSTMLKNINNGDYDAACYQLTKWVYANVNGKKVVLKGLEVRAQAQYKYCMGEEPADYKTTMSSLGG